jgi:hypothetical protein
MYDLNVFPIDPKRDSQPQGGNGFRAVSPPRRAVRSRAEDLLILSLFLRGKEQLSTELQEKWIEQLTHSFYKTSGSVTSALRSLIESLNLTMLENNLKMARQGSTVTGAMNLVAVHRRSLYIVQSGLIHAYTLTHEGLQHFTDTSRTDRGLGFSRTPAVRYYQADLGTGGYLFMSDNPPNTWTDELLFADGFPSIEKLRRRLLNQASPDIRLDLVQLVPGEGQITLDEPAVKAAQSEGVVATAAPVEIVEPAAEIPAKTDSEEVFPDKLIGEEIDFESLDSETQKVNVGAEAVSVEEPGDALPPEAEEEVIVDEVPLEDVEETPKVVVAGVSSAIEGEKDPPPTIVKELPEEPVEKPLDPVEKKAQRQAAKERRLAQRQKIKRDGLQGLASFFDWWHQAREKVSGFFRSFAARFSPSESGAGAQMSRGKMLLIAVLVPLVVVAIAVSIYLVRGRTLQHQYYYDQAQAFALSAMDTDDPNAARNLWSEAMTNLEQAEVFRKTDDTAELKAEVQGALDRLDGAFRLDYRPAIAGELFSGVNITRIVSYGLDLYLFDAASGSVIHATGGGQGYRVDADFLCGPGNFSGGGIDTFVDMVALPINNPYGAHILAIDALGNVAYCSPGQSPVIQSLPMAGGTAGAVKKITYGNNSLYVLEGATNSIQVFSATNGQFLDSPVNYFGGAKPEEIPNLSKVVDLAINGPELYLLRGNGKLINCVYSGLADNPVTCENPVAYVDGRAGKEDQEVVIPESEFVSVLYTTPPDPSVSILDATHGDIYRFSLRFRLHQRLRPNLDNYEITSPTATAFTIGIDQVAFIAFGNQVFYAYVN